jgi:hypothetical protein
MYQKNIIIFICFFSIIIITKNSPTELKPKEGLLNIEYEYIGESGQEKMHFQIPLENENININSLTLKLSKPLKDNRDQCTASCLVVNSIMSCEISKSECQLLDQSSKIIINSIIGGDYFFSNINSLVSEIQYETSSLEMTCSNFRLSFFLYSNNLNVHPIVNKDFSFTAFYRNKEVKVSCILPKTVNYLPCIINATKILFKKDYTIDFALSSPINVDSGLNISITNLKNYKLEGDCGKEIDSSIGIKKLNYIKIFKLFFIINFLFF